MSEAPAGWSEVVETLQVRAPDRPALLAALNAHFGPLGGGVSRPAPTANGALLGRLLIACPCLYTQLEVRATARATVHLCEITLGERISGNNVHDAFLVQHPGKGPGYLHAPQLAASDGGAIMEMLCSEVLEAAGVPRMELTANGEDKGWPQWRMPGHVLLNEGGMNAHRAFGDILLPCAPTNLVISVKSEKARERLLYSSNAIEGVGFGFFDEPEEFWSESRMNLYKRMGFSAIYMPEGTLAAIDQRLAEQAGQRFAVNINGTALYRPLSAFGPDMRRVVGKSSLTL